MSRFKRNQLKKTRANAELGHPLPGCYAKSLGNCSGSLTGEHYISRSVLKLLSDDGKTVPFQGLSWQPRGKSQDISINTFQSKILCGDHNSQLTGLDAMAGSIVETVERFHMELTEDDTGSSDLNFAVDGFQLERWLLKVIVGAAFSGNLARASGEAVRDFIPNEQIIEVLFGKRRFPRGWGLYFPTKLNSLVTESIPSRFGVVGVHNPVAGLDGGIVDLSLLKFLLVMVDPPRNQPDSMLNDCAYRPDTLTLTRKGIQKRINLNWGRRANKRDVTLVIEKGFRPS